jgi:hypothetical protein
MEASWGRQETRRLTLPLDYKNQICGKEVNAQSINNKN